MTNTRPITIRITDPAPGSPLAEMAEEHPAQVLDVSLAQMRELMRAPKPKPWGSTKRNP